LFIAFTAVDAYIEDFGVDGQPSEVALSCSRNSSVDGLPVILLTVNGWKRTLLCDERLSPSWQTDHDHADLGVLDLYASTVSLPAGAC
jgi:hypothetical protein